MKHMRLVALLVLSVPSVLRAQVPAYSSPAEVRSAFRKLLDRPRVPLDVKVNESSTDKDGATWERLSFVSEKKADGSVERVPVLLLRPAGGQETKRPAVLVLHGTGGNKEGQRELLRDLARRGIIGVAIDGRYHGERSSGAKGTAYNEAIIRVARQTRREA